MRSSICLMTGVAVAAFAATSAWAESPFYVSGSIGGYFRESDSTSASFFHSDAPTTQVDGTEKRGFDTGVVGDLALGYRLNPHIRLEAELGYATDTGDTINPLTAASGFPNAAGQTFRRTSGDRFTRFTGTVNAFYDFSPIAGRFTPYVGAGVGGSADRQSAGEFMASSGALFHGSSGSSAQGLAMLEAGVAIPITRNLSLVPAYRYVHYFADNEDMAHVVKVSLRYAF